MASEGKGPVANSTPVTVVTEEKVPTLNTTSAPLGDGELEKGEQSSEDGHAHWRPGFFSQFPWIGIGALGGVLACLVAAVVVLVCSNHKTQTRTADDRPWPKAVAPNVLISIFNSVANICFGIAISESFHCGSGSSRS